MITKFAPYLTKDGLPRAPTFAEWAEEFCAFKNYISARGLSFRCKVVKWRIDARGNLFGVIDGVDNHTGRIYNNLQVGRQEICTIRHRPFRNIIESSNWWYFLEGPEELRS